MLKKTAEEKVREDFLNYKDELIESSSGILSFDEAIDNDFYFNGKLYGYVGQLELINYSYIEATRDNPFEESGKAEFSYDVYDLEEEKIELTDKIKITW